MKILALDTTGLVASVALVDENKTIAEFTTNKKKLIHRLLCLWLKISKIW